ncbi:OB-fold domain-containing protein [Dactylosporangium sp. NPDC051485]|uniref:Zn-ribbon domain-containing OB-fold protein n=1 Tax=Dactylosporangium sp. NPDC051485 TaxID=3154846 RepID=UPI0034483D96
MSTSAADRTPARDRAPVAATDAAAQTDRVAGDGALAIPAIARDAAGELSLIASHCSSCGLHRYPPQAYCPNDQTATQTVPLSRHGRIYEAVQVHLAPAGFQAPYLIGYVDLPEGVRVFARLAAQPGYTPRNGDPVLLRFGTVRHDPSRIGPVFEVTQDSRATSAE